jgi:hypothetical protein
LYTARAQENLRASPPREGGGGEPVLFQPFTAAPPHRARARSGPCRSPFTRASGANNDQLRSAALAPPPPAPVLAVARAAVLARVLRVSVLAVARAAVLAHALPARPCSHFAGGAALHFALTTAKTVVLLAAVFAGANFCT